MRLEQISTFLEQLGWARQSVTDTVVKGHHQGVFGTTKVLFHVHDEGLRIAINPVLERPAEMGWSRSVNQLVTALNRESPNINIGLDREGDLYVTINLPKQEISFEQFTYVLLNLCQVSEQLTVPVLQAQAYDRISIVHSGT